MRTVQATRATIAVKAKRLRTRRSYRLAWGARAKADAEPERSAEQRRPRRGAREAGGRDRCVSASAVRRAAPPAERLTTVARTGPAATSPRNTNENRRRCHRRFRVERRRVS